MPARRDPCRNKDGLRYLSVLRSVCQRCTFRISFRHPMISVECTPHCLYLCTYTYGSVHPQVPLPIARKMPSPTQRVSFPQSLEHSIVCSRCFVGVSVLPKRYCRSCMACILYHFNIAGKVVSDSLRFKVSGHMYATCAQAMRPSSDGNCRVSFQSTS